MDNFKPYYEVAADITIAAIAASRGSALNNPQAVADFYRTIYAQMVESVAGHVMEREEELGGQDQEMNGMQNEEI